MGNMWVGIVQEAGQRWGGEERLQGVAIGEEQGLGDGVSRDGRSGGERSWVRFEEEELGDLLVGEVRRQ